MLELKAAVGWLIGSHDSQSVLTKRECTPPDPKSTSTSKRARYTLVSGRREDLPAEGVRTILDQDRRAFQGRTAGAIKVRYHTKLKTADLFRSGSRHLCDHSQVTAA